MKVQSFIIPKNAPTELYYQVDRGKAMYPKLHQHEEAQLSLIKKGSGLLFINGAFVGYQPLDLIIIGSKVPHVFVSDTSSEEAEMRSLYFNPQNLVGGLVEQDEVKDLITLFQEAQYGLKASSKAREEVELFGIINNKQGLARKIAFFRFLEQLAQCSLEVLSYQSLNPIISSDQGLRMRNVIEFTLNNHDKQLSLSQIAEVACMTRNAFCKYFKANYNKTYFTFVNEIRIDRAITLMSNHPKMLLKEIALNVGFASRSQFCKSFFRYKNTTPSEFRKRLLKNVKRLDT